MRTILAFPSLVLVVLLSACAGSVGLDEVDGFGTVGSAVWFEIIADDGETAHFMTLTNLPGACGKFSAIADEANSLLDDWAGQLLSDPLSYCSEGDDVYELLGELTEDIFREDSRFLNIYLRDGGQLLSEPTTDTYESSDNDEGFWFDLQYYDENPYTEAASDWNESTCGLGLDLSNSFDEWRNGSPGTLELDLSNNDKSVKGKLESDVIEDDGDSSGEIKADFNAGRCTIELSTDSAIFPLLSPFGS